MHEISDNIDDLLRATYQHIQKQGVRSEATRGAFTAVQGALLELTVTQARLSRSENRGKIVSCLGELIWILSGSKLLKGITPYISLYEEESDDGETVYGAYGPRIFAQEGFHQFEETFELLSKNPNSRKAVMMIATPTDFEKYRKEVPCTTSIQYRIIDEKLTAITTMRSNDAYFGLPHDIFVFTMMQEIMACKLGIETGPYKHFVGDLHIYQKDEGNIERYLSEGYQTTLLPMPAMPKPRIDEALNWLVESERAVRENPFAVLNNNNIDSYWLNLFGFVASHLAKDTKKSNANRFTELIEDPIYQVLLSDRKKK